jgi:hypothetical protein
MRLPFLTYFSKMCHIILAFYKNLHHIRFAFHPHRFFHIRKKGKEKFRKAYIVRVNKNYKIMGMALELPKVELIEKKESFNKVKDIIVYYHI